MTTFAYCKKTIDSEIPVIWVDKAGEKVPDTDYVSGKIIKKIVESNVIKHKVINGVEYIFIDIYFNK